MSDIYTSGNFTSNFESNQFAGNDDSKIESFYSSYNYGDKAERHAFFDKDYDFLVTSLSDDHDFLKAFNSLNRSSNDFATLNEKAKVEALAKCFFTLKYEKDQVLTSYYKLKETVDQMKSCNETYANEKVEKHKQENYYLQCELEELRNKFQIAKEKKEEAEKNVEENLSKLEKSKEKLKEKENLYYKAVVEKNELEKKLDGQIFKLKNELNVIKQKNDELEKENNLLKADLEMSNTQNEDYIIKLADLNSLYQEVCDRNMMLEKICKQQKQDHSLLDNDFSTQKSNKNHLENFLTGGEGDQAEESKNSQAPESFTVNMKFNINKINKKEKKLSQFLNNQSKKQVVTKEMEISNRDSEEEENKQCEEKESDNNIHNEYGGGGGVLLTCSSFDQNYNTEEMSYMETVRTENNDIDSERMREDGGTKRNNSQSSLFRTNKNSHTSHNTNNSHNSNNTHNTNQSISVYESQYESKFANDEYNSNQYECLKNMGSNNVSSGNTQSQANLQVANAASGAKKRKYDYDTNCFVDD